ncbi:MAG TPA: peptide chain release factor N(5)-glutamine methyltransferase [Candidatus Gracilibacteria bacterium]|nr:peptide chain release factor N(5)-glutamine methyltransferase [Candidatus Gracilibacteria bacterium]
MTISELLQESKLKLGDQEPDFLGVELLIAYVLGRDREYLVAHGDERFSEDALVTFQELFGRFYAGEPVAYLINRKEFYGLDFFVDKRVLVPRPETELLVDKVLDFVRSANGGSATGSGAAALKILDIGTGSGCIAVALAKNITEARITAVDVSVDALQVAKLNAERHDVADRVSFLESDLLAGVEGVFDVVVANLPYIGEERHRYISREAYEYEPHVALFGGSDGLRLYAALFEQLSRKGWKPKILLGEFGFLQGDEMRELLNKFFTHEQWEIQKDYASIERTFVVRCTELT